MQRQTPGTVGCVRSECVDCVCDHLVLASAVMCTKPALPKAYCDASHTDHQFRKLRA
jgi:hypothetical protein